MTALTLDEQEQAWLAGAHGKAMQLAMQLLLAAAKVSEADEFVPIEMAHINSCHYSGPLSLDFAEFLVAEDATLAVPTHTNASLISCSSPHVRPTQNAPGEVTGAERLMEIYEQLGCSSMWTCAPYQEATGRPAFGAQIVGAESNAVGFFNSVLGARTNKYGDLLDISAAMTGRVPLAGLHTDDARRATHVFDVGQLSTERLRDPNLYHLLGVLLGQRVGSEVGIFTGLAAASEDQLKAIAAGAAAAGGVDMFHVEGITPEAETLDAATQGIRPTTTTAITDADLLASAAILSSADLDGPLSAVCLGTPHFSVSEFEEMLAILDGRRVHEDITFLVTTSRSVAAEIDLRGWGAVLGSLGVDVVLDTCTYYTPRATGIDGLAMTNSAKWAYYAQGMLDVPVAFASLERCVESAVSGQLR